MSRVSICRSRASSWHHDVVLTLSSSGACKTMGSGRRGALFVALVFLLQWSASVWTASAMPLGPQLDVFGNPLCATGPGSSPVNSGGDHAKVTACCTAGCHLASSVLESGKGASWTAAVPLVAAAEVRLQGREAAVLARHHDPGRQRAPPHSMVEDERSRAIVRLFCWVCCGPQP